MKSFIYGLAAMLLCVVFLAFQTDINQMQRESFHVYESANEIANAAALQLKYNSDDESDIYTYANGYTEFETAQAFQAGYQVATSNFQLNGSFQSSRNYFADGFTVTIYLFNESGKVYKSVNNQAPTLVPKVFQRGMQATEFISEMTAESNFQINFPCVVCIVDAGAPRFRLQGFDGLAKIKKIGVYEYKDATTS